jgi:hypothetical protein
MKKSLLIPVSALLICNTVSAQHSLVNVPTIKDKAVANRGVKASILQVENPLTGMSTTNYGGGNVQRASSFSTLGTSSYQLQTNNAIENRIVANSDGTISAAFTFAAAADPWADRGTGYLYNNGTSWSAAPTVRTEPVRTGWPSLLVMGDNSENTITHATSPAPGNLYFSKRAVKGTGSWTHNASVLASTAAYGNFWPRSAVGGTTNNTIHMISISNPTDGAATPNPVFYKGQQGCITYCRSQDAGATWDILHYVNPLHDSTLYYGFGADSYAIDAKGNTVAYVLGGDFTDLILMKSTDNGTTWTKTILMTFPIPFYNDAVSDVNGDSVADTINTNDGNVSVLIDDLGTVHVWVGRMRILDDTAGDGLTTYFTGTAGLLYWNEGMGASAPVMVAALEDTDGDMAISISAWGSYFNSLTSMPSAGIDNMNTIHVTYAGVLEYTDFGDGKSYRNIYHMSSSDHGITWTTPTKVNMDMFNEQVFCSLARNLDPACLKMIYQSDIAPGHGVNSTSPDYSNNAGIIDDQIYACYDATNGVADVENLSTMFNMYPNPSNSNVSLNTLTPMTQVNVYNVTGECVLNMTPNSNTATLNVAGLPGGLYMVSVKLNGRTISKQLIKE